uniref:Uncharacterized protein n=1 Tax=Nothobranchius kuhntae TaxID=321403 RepID=A0A1A8J0K0_NOTKU
MTSRKNKKAKKSTAERAEDGDSQLADDANASSPGVSRSYSPSPSGESRGTEDEEDPSSLTLILKELRGVRKEVKEFRRHEIATIGNKRRVG